MKNYVLTMAAMVAVGLASIGTAQALPIQGSIGLAPLGGISTAVAADNLGAATTISMLGILTSAGGTGDFSGYPGMVNVGGAVLSTAALGTFTFGDGVFGTFAASSGIQFSNTGLSREFRFLGTFSPGTDFPLLDPATGAGLILSFTQSGGVGNTISGSYTLDMEPNFTTSVPEPSSLALLGLGGLGLVYRLRRRAK